MEFAYYPGCTLKAQAKNFEDSALSASRALGIELKELKRWNCCGTVYSLATDDLMRQLAPIRVLIRAVEEGHDELVTLCSMCYNAIKRANSLVRRDEEKLKKMSEFMDREIEYRGDLEVLHLLQVLRDRLGLERVREAVVKPLGNLKVSPYYGCLLMRPREVAIDDPKGPRVLEDLMASVGADVVDSPERAFCCGSYLTINRKDAVADSAYKIITAAVSRGAEALVTSCPLCFFNLDTRQREASQRHGDMAQVPILYFTQLMALSFGLEDSCGFDLHYIDPRHLLRSKGLIGRG